MTAGAGGRIARAGVVFFVPLAFDFLVFTCKVDGHLESTLRARRAITWSR
jgi:hypothetical protein